MKELAEQSFNEAKNTEVILNEETEDFIAHIAQQHGRKIIFFSDDDDLVAPDLLPRISAEEGYDALRWNAPVFMVTILNRPVWQYMPLLALKLRRLSGRSSRMLGWLPDLLKYGSNSGTPSISTDSIFQTNNYAITEQFLDKGAIESVFDHSHASALFMKRRSLKIDSLGNRFASTTNKHPCSATTLNWATKLHDSEDALRWLLRDYVARADSVIVPEELRWCRMYIEGTVAIFREALG